MTVDGEDAVQQLNYMTTHPHDSWMPQQSQDSPHEVLIGLAMEEVIEEAGIVIARSGLLLRDGGTVSFWRRGGCEGGAVCFFCLQEDVGGLWMGGIEA
jgi:hypothetical protein